jgi:hypothetical protein
MITDQDIEKALDWLAGNGRNAAKARAEREYLDEYKGVLKCQIMREHSDQSLGAQEALAKSDPRYNAHLNAWKEAVERDEFFRWMRVAAEAKIEAWRTQSSNERALSKI